MTVVPQSKATSSTSQIEWSIQYDAVCSLYTHPRQLAALAIKQGMSPPAIETAHILELGCATGGNLTPIAISLPKSVCVGIDPFEQQIFNARERAAEAGVHNVTYLPLGVSDLDELEGPFDYIIAHGLFSWISDEHRQDTLKLCRALLAPNGIAYISYNTYPYWQFERNTRSLLRWQHKLLTRDTSLEDQDDSHLVTRARKLLSVFSRYTLGAPPNLLRDTYQNSSVRLQQLPDWYVVHEYLLEHNRAFYFNEWVQLTRAAGLDYLGDAASNTELAAQMISPMLIRELEFTADDEIEFLQGLDLLVNRGLRRSVICHAEALPVASTPRAHLRRDPWTLSALLEGEYGDELYIASPYTIQGELTHIEQPVTYINRILAPITTFSAESEYDNALLLLLSSAWPNQLSLKDTLAQAESLLRDFDRWRPHSRERLNRALHMLLCQEVITHPTWGALSVHIDPNTPQKSPRHPPEYQSSLPKLSSLIFGAYGTWPQSFTNHHHTSSFPSRAAHWLIPHVHRGESRKTIQTLLDSSPFADTPLDQLIAELVELAITC